jgi:Tfp pilus assembly protein PilO
MNFKKLPPEKRRTLGLVLLASAIAVGGLGFGLIKPQFDTLNDLDKQQVAAQAKLRQMREAVKRMDAFATDLDEYSQRLSELQSGMASGDPYAWIMNAIRTFKLPYKVDIPQISQPGAVSDVNLLPRFPYKQVTVSVSGTAYFYDFGKFLADFENHFPHIRVLNLELEPARNAVLDEREKLLFKMELVVLVNPNP